MLYECTIKSHSPHSGADMKSSPPCWRVFLTWFELPWIQLLERRGRGTENMIPLCALSHTHTAFVCVCVSEWWQWRLPTCCNLMPKVGLCSTLEKSVSHSDQVLSCEYCNCHSVVLLYFSRSRSHWICQLAKLWPTWHKVRSWYAAKDGLADSGSLSSGKEVLFSPLAVCLFVLIPNAAAQRH